MTLVKKLKICDFLPLPWEHFVQTQKTDENSSADCDLDCFSNISLEKELNTATDNTGRH